MAKKKIAIVGTGVSGLVAARNLYQDYDVDVYEAADRIGGHAATIDVLSEGKKYAVDTAFVVFNEKTYPRFCALLNELGVEKQSTSMGFACSDTCSQIEYSANGFFVTLRDIFSWKKIYLGYHILRFNRIAKNLAVNNKDQNNNKTIADFIAEYNIPQLVVDLYVVPLIAIIWSQDKKDTLNFSLKFLLDFFLNHGLFRVSDGYQWFVIAGGSRSYVQELIKPYASRIYCNKAVKKIRRQNGKVILSFSSGEQKEYDQVVIATHSDHALSMLEDGSEKEREILGSINYSSRKIVVHSDESVFAKNKKHWCGWNIKVADNKKPVFSYNMSIMQSLKTDTSFIVTFDPEKQIPQENVFFETQYAHPIFDNAAVIAQKRLGEVQGVKNTWFVGAYWRNGFHEDGVWSAQTMVEDFRKKVR